MPKRDLIAGLQVMLDLGQLQIAKGLPETEVLFHSRTTWGYSTIFD